MAHLNVIGEVDAVVDDRVVQVDEAGLDELHDQGRSDRLRHRCQVVRRVGGRQDPVLDVGVAEALGPHQFPIANDSRRHARDGQGLPHLVERRREAHEVGVVRRHR